jgi:anti-sigma B factor antagonist
MNADVTYRSAGNATVIYLDGDLTTNSSPEIEAEILEILEKEAGNLVLNIEKVNFVASTGLRVILSIGKRLNGKGLKLTVCSMNPTTRSVFEMSGFTKLFPTFATEDEALKSL